MPIHHPCVGRTSLNHLQSGFSNLHITFQIFTPVVKSLHHLSTLSDVANCNIPPLPTFFTSHLSPSSTFQCLCRQCKLQCLGRECKACRTSPSQVSCPSGLSRVGRVVWAASWQSRPLFYVLQGSFKLLEVLLQNYYVKILLERLQKELLNPCSVTALCSGDHTVCSFSVQCTV